MKILFFGSLREQLGTGELELPLPDGVNNIGDLLTELKQRDAQWQQSLGTGTLLCAVNQVMAGEAAAINDGDEVALFPPVTGG
ncbi:molybdopterin converting factor subunit 1 [Porticoccus sp.]